MKVAGFRARIAWGCGSLTGFELDVEGPASVKGLVGSDRVEELPVGLRLEAEVVPFVDL